MQFLEDVFSAQSLLGDKLTPHLFRRFINARRRIVQPMIDASSQVGKSPVVTVFKSRKRKSSSPEMAHHEPHLAHPANHYQPAAYHSDYHYPSMHSSFYTDTSLPATPHLPQSYPPCQYLAAPQMNNNTPPVASYPTCIEPRPQAVQPSIGHWSSSHHSQNFQYPVHTTETQLQHGQFYVKAS